MSSEGSASEAREREAAVLIDAFCELLRRAMHTKYAANGHKKPLSEEGWLDIFKEMETELGEFHVEAVWAKRFEREPGAVLLELADLAIYGAEVCRRVGALS